MIDQIDTLIGASLTSLVDDISSPEWSGKREREIVSLFCFGHLLRQIRPSSFLCDPTQIAIDVAVPQVLGQAHLSGKLTSKGQVCKDVVIWPRPRMTCWDASGRPTIRPASILEWKHNEGEVSCYDVEWLQAFSAETEHFVGYAVCTNSFRTQSFRLSCTRVCAGNSQSGWLLIE
jgi:hypothetical protein